MAEPAVDDLLAAVDAALDLVRGEVAASEARGGQVRGLVEAIRAFADTGVETLATGLEDERQRLRSLGTAVEAARHDLAGASTEVGAIDEAARHLMPALASLKEEEDEAIAGIDALRTMVDGLDARMATHADSLASTLSDHFDPVAKVGRDATEAVTLVAKDALDIAATVGDSIATLTHTINNETRETLGQGWDRMFTDLGGAFTSADSANQSLFDHSGQTTQTAVISNAQATLATIGDHADQVRDVLRKVSDAIETARDLQTALRLASGGL